MGSPGGAAAEVGRGGAMMPEWAVHAFEFGVGWVLASILVALFKLWWFRGKREGDD